MIPKQIQYKLHKLFAPNTVMGTGLKIHSYPRLIKLGTEYGGWVIPLDMIQPGAVCYCAGAGEDISFDVALAEKYKAEVFIIDPTPRAKIHYDTLVSNTQQGKKTNINHKENLFYEMSGENLSRLKFLEVGLWKEESKMPFYLPKNEAHVSHSIVNLQKTENYIEVKVQRLSKLMEAMGHQSIDLLKLDIEGAEYEVIETIIEDKPDIKLLAVEFEKTSDKEYVKNVKKYLQKLLDADYCIVSADLFYNCTLIKKSYLIQ